MTLIANISRQCANKVSCISVCKRRLRGTSSNQPSYSNEIEYEDTDLSMVDEWHLLVRGLFNDVWDADRLNI